MCVRRASCLTPIFIYIHFFSVLRIFSVVFLVLFSFLTFLLFNFISFVLRVYYLWCQRTALWFDYYPRTDCRSTDTRRHLCRSSSMWNWTILVAIDLAAAWMGMHQIGRAAPIVQCDSFSPRTKWHNATRMHACNLHHSCSVAVLFMVYDNCKRWQTKTEEKRTKVVTVCWPGKWKQLCRICRCRRRALFVPHWMIESHSLSFLTRIAAMVSSHADTTN